MKNAEINFINIATLFAENQSLIFANRFVEFVMIIFRSLFITNAVESSAKGIVLSLDPLVAVLIPLT